MVFKHSIKGFSNYICAKGGYVLRLNYCTKHHHCKDKRLVSFDKNNRIYLWDDLGQKHRLSKRQLKRMLIEVHPIDVRLKSNIELIPF